MSKYWNLRETYNWCEEIWDFFQEKIITRSYARLWNLQNPDNKINVNDFSIFNPEHLDFIREVFLVEGLAEEFLLYVRSYWIKLWNIDRFPYNSQQIVSFILVWNDVRWRINTYSEPLSTIFSEKVFNTLNQSAPYPIADYNGSQITQITWLQFLINSNFSPINYNWEIIYWVASAARYGYFIVVNEYWDFLNVDPNWNILTEEKVQELLSKGIGEDIKQRNKILNFLMGDGTILNEEEWQLLEAICENNNLSTDSNLTDILDTIRSEITNLETKQREYMRWKLKIVN